MSNQTALVVTSISAPNDVLKSLASGAKENGIQFIVIGDSKSPSEFHLGGCDFFSLENQKKLDLKFAQICPEKHYARKNIGYLIAQKNGANLVLETDDDNFPTPEFWTKRRRKHEVKSVENTGWLNAFRYFTDELIWPRGFSLEHIQQPLADINSFPVKEIISPVQQGLADDNPDVDAMYRLSLPLPLKFRKEEPVAIGKGSWCPFNSQNTSWFKEAFPLMYLPAYCSFRMTDIWRSFVAQRIMWENNWHLLYHHATVWQERNEHNLLKDFQDEIPGYLNNDRIVKSLEDLNLKSGSDHLGDNLITCYQKLTEMSLVGKEELALLDAWLADII